MVERIAELVREKKIDGIADLRDESDRDGYRVVIELKRDAERDVVLNQLYRFTPLQSSFGANMVALDGGRPLLMTLKDMLVAFVAFREEVVSRRTKHPARQGARPRPYAGRPRHRGRQYRRGDQADPRLEGRQRGARGLDGARMAGDHGGDADRIDRRSAPQSERPRAPRGCRSSRPRRSSICACSASPRSAATRSRPSSTSSPPRSPIISKSCARARASRPSSRTSWRS